MGIPRLRQLLEPYSEQINLRGRQLVIDGPGLAYHVLHYCQREATTLFDLPSYTLLGETAIRWLDGLSESGANVSAIYFDGYLPYAKGPERKRRVMDLSKGLRSYFSLYPSGVPKTAKKQVPISFSSSTGTSGPKKLPTPAFLVPAVLEALCVSETYASVTKLVPGEADIFCARHVSSSGGIILTSDSDLLVHDLGPEGSVAFFGTVEFKTHAGMPTATVAEYSGARICKRLSLPQDKGLSALGFQVSIDPHLTLNRAIPRAREQITSGSNALDYNTFMQQYLSPETVQNISLAPIVGQLLDPRISELLLQLQSKADDNTETSMYLPSLADSPARTSAWEASTSLRQIAYAAAGISPVESSTSVVEYRRLQSLPGGTRVGTVPSSELEMVCNGHMRDLELVGRCVREPGLDRLLFAILQDMRWSEENGKGRILSLEMLQAAANATLNVGSWDFVHFHAQVQGMYYSTRMLHQVCSFVTRDRQLPEPLDKMQGRLEYIPVLDIPSISEFTTLIERIRDRDSADLRLFFESINNGEELSPTIQSILNPKEEKAKGQNKRKRERKSSSTGQQQAKPAEPSRRSNNPFDLLGDW